MDTESCHVRAFQPISTRPGSSLSYTVLAHPKAILLKASGIRGLRAIYYRGCARRDSSTTLEYSRQGDLADSLRTQRGGFRLAVPRDAPRPAGAPCPCKNLDKYRKTTYGKPLRGPDRVGASTIGLLFRCLQRAGVEDGLDREAVLEFGQGALA